MALYNTTVIHWPPIIGDYVAWIRFPFDEYVLDPIFKVVNVDIENYTFDIEAVQSEFLPSGTVYSNQPYRGFRKVKLTPINTDLTYNKTV